MVSDWYVSFYNKKVNLFDLTVSQIDEYENKAKYRNALWATK